MMKITGHSILPGIDRQSLSWVWNLLVGKAPEEGDIVLQSNDYLCLSGNREIAEAQIAALRDQTKDSLMSAVFLQEGSQQKVFESRMAEWVGYESAMLCQSGWAANVGLLQALFKHEWAQEMGEGNPPVYIDKLTHASFWEGIKSAGVRKCHIFRHNDVENLEALIRKHGPGIILVDSVYSSIGTICPLRDVASVSKQHGCMLIVDESHSLGLYGEQGCGLVNELGIRDQVQIVTASLAKAFAGRAGIIFASHELCRSLPITSLPAIFSSVVLPHEIAGLTETLEQIKIADAERARLAHNATYLRKGLRRHGISILSQSHIISLVPGEEWRTKITRDALEEKRIFGSVFCHPATSKDKSLVRFSVHCNLDEKKMDSVIEACRYGGEKTRVGQHDPGCGRARFIYLDDAANHKSG